MFLEKTLILFLVIVNLEKFLDLRKRKESKGEVKNEYWDECREEKKRRAPEGGCLEKNRNYLIRNENLDTVIYFGYNYS